MAEEFAKEQDLVFLCGHYEGIDERVLEEIVTDYVSIGDYVLTGGELPAMVMMDAISRLVPGVLHNEASAEFESFQGNLLEHPHYSRPEVWHEKRVPEVLLSGHHANIEKWRREQSVIRTAERRPDVTTGSATDKISNGYSFKLKNTINPIAVRIILGHDTGKFIGLTEAEVMSSSISYTRNSSASLKEIGRAHV